MSTFGGAKTRVTILRIEQTFRTLTNELKTELSATTNVAATTDGWDAKYNKRTYSTLTLHYLDPENPCKLVSRVVDTLEFGEASHTGINIAEKLNESFDKWEIRCKTKFIVFWLKF